MPDALNYLETVTCLSEFAATRPEAITMAMGSRNIVSATRLTGLSSVDNQIEVADGIANILVEYPDSDVVFMVEFDAAGNILELRNLANGEGQGIDIGGTTLSAGGADRLRGGGDDTISGGNGNDHIIGGAGADVIDGGAGFNRIFDFKDGVDRLNFADHGTVTSIAGLTIRTFKLGADTRIDFAVGGFIIRVRVDVTDVTASDFVF